MPNSKATKIIAMFTNGTTVANIAKLTKTKLADVQIIIDEHLAAQPVLEILSPVVDESTQVVVETIATEELVNNKASLLAGLMSAAAQQAEVVAQAPIKTKRVSTGIKSSSAKDAEGNSRQRRNYDVATRKITVFYSDSLNLAHVTSHLGFTTKSYDSAIKLARRDLMAQKMNIPLAQAADLRMEIIDQEVNTGEDLKVAKAAVYDQVSATGRIMLGLRPRVQVTEVVQPEAETVVETTPVSEEQVQELNAEFGEALA